MDNHRDVCAWKRCRSESVILYAGLGLCAWHEEKFHGLRYDEWRAAEREGVPEPTMRETLARLVKPESRGEMTEAGKPEEMTA